MDQIRLFSSEMRHQLALAAPISMASRRRLGLSDMDRRDPTVRGCPTAVQPNNNGDTRTRAELVNSPGCGQKTNWCSFCSRAAPREGLQSRVTHSTESRRAGADLARPDATTMRLPGKAQIMEVIDGVYRES